MSLADRIARLEAKMLASANPVVPVLRIAMDGDDESLPYCIEHDGRTWAQEAGEPLASMMDRAEAEALRRFVLAGKFPVLVLVARRAPFE
jgi:hypothetical protein